MPRGRMLIDHNRSPWFLALVQAWGHGADLIRR